MTTAPLPTAPPASGAGLRLERLAVGYRTPRRGRRTRVVLTGLDAQARRGELTVLLGPNGAGKSTLLRTLAGLRPPLGGRALLDGADLARLRPRARARRLAVVLTERVDAGLLTARELVSLGRHPHTAAAGTLRAADLAVVGWALGAVDATHLADRPVGELSDGERQRVMIARALAQQPAVLLADEPTAFLDAPSRVAVTGLLRRLARERDLAVVAATHDLELALRVADHVWLLDRAGRLHTGTPEEIALEGTLAATFDTAELAFDLAAGAFTLRRPEGGSVRVRATGAPRLRTAAAQALTRQGWQVVPAEATGATEAEVAAAPDGTSLTVWAAGGRWVLPGVAELARWAREQHDRRPPGGWPLRRATSEGVAAALRQAASFGPFFDLASPEQGPGAADAPAAAGSAGVWQPLTSLLDPASGDLARLVEGAAAKLKVEGEPRVAASLLFQGLAARLWSPLLGCLATSAVVPDLEPGRLVWWEGKPDADTQLRLGLLDPGGWELPADLPPDQHAEQAAGLLARGLVEAWLRPLAAAVREQVPVAEGLLWGNAASALAGAVQVLEQGHTRQPAQGLERAEAATERTRLSAERLLAAPPLAGTGTLTVGDRGETSFQRVSCCLYYRVPGGGTCGDCPLTGRDAPAVNPAAGA